MVRESAVRMKRAFTKSFKEEGLWGVAKTVSRGARLGLSLACLRLIHLQLALLPSEALARLKASINPTISLDYDKVEIKLAADNLMSFQRSNACRKEPETIQWIEENVKDQDVFYDIGANVGTYSLVAGRFFGGDIQVYAFEPSFSTFEILCKNIILNNCQNRIFPYMICLSDNERLETFNYFSIDAGQSKHTIGGNYIDCTGQQFIPEYSQKIFSYSIDFLVKSWGFPPPNLVKLDVDGTELNILRGAAETLRAGAVRSILVEAGTEELDGKHILSFLHEVGFTLATKVRHEGSGMSNLIFKRGGPA